MLINLPLHNALVGAEFGSGEVGLVRKDILLLTIVFLFAGFAFADVQFTSTSVSPSTLRPGNTGSVSFTITNTGTAGISGLTLYPSGSGLEFSTDRVSVGTIGTSGSTPMNIQFRVSENVDSGVYNLVINAYWSETTTSGGTGYKLVQIPVTVSKQTIFQISSNPVTVGIGDDFELNAQIKNTGGRATNVILALDSSYLIPKDNTKMIFSSIGKDETINVSIPISTNLSMPAGVQTIPVTITYQDDLGNIQQTSATLATVQAVKGFVDFSVVPNLGSSASPGKKVRLSLDVVNDGTLMVKSVRCTLSSASSSFLPLGSSQRLLGEIKPGGSTSVFYDVGISSSASPGYYPLIVTIDYLNKQGESQATITKNVGVEVVGEPALAVITSTNPSPVTPGGKYSLGVQVSNVGTTDVKSLSVTSESDSFTILDNSPTSFIGNLKTDDYSQVSYSVLVGKDLQPGKYPINVKMNFMDSYNVRREITETAYLQVVAPDVAAMAGVGGGDGSGMNVILVVGLIVVVVAIYLIYRRATRCNGKKPQPKS